MAATTNVEAATVLALQHQLLEPTKSVLATLNLVSLKTLPSTPVNEPPETPDIVSPLP